jgi:DNA-binding SARP family transcriptional activator
MGALRVELFGTPRIFFGDQAVRLEGPPKTFPLLAMLLLAEEPVERAAAAANLWPDSPEDAARANLRRHVAYLERALRGFNCGGVRGRPPPRLDDRARTEERHLDGRRRVR